MPGVTVTKRRPCANHDAACTEEVTAEIWRRYPEQIRQMCRFQRIKSIDTAFLEAEIPSFDKHGIQAEMSPQTQALCEYGHMRGLER